ncbi:ABC transporter ATP-binding protein [Macrococcus hajekii]|uniref:ABC transporter ATP-binding protein n=1 Tax=Macrococcus hajekii TaxID=198482 RepID=A0A4R6BJ95_9STAP|nr:ABC transporter ATP-binding protein [Macrococcus hajekii]TDM01773.1 ABC transporter ATP-binding protein [Macrococcus hajekii]GGB07321.1 bacitracin ABC transporter ATP-binding protein [Macrococcus hajekii]
MSIITMSDVSKVYDTKTAVHQLSLKIEAGEIFGLLGPSGSGKTTTIKMLTGETAASEGFIQVMQVKGSALQTSDYRKQIGILSDNSALYERLTIYDNLKMFAGLYEVSNERIEEVLKFVDLIDEKKTVVKKLSKGMRQRILLAKALIHQPEILFLDEPTSALDPQTSMHIHKGLLQLKKDGVTIFLTTHDMTEAETLCDRIALINEGQLIAVDEPAELRYQYSDDSINVELKDGSSHSISMDEAGADMIRDWIRSSKIKRMQTNEPTLSDVFIKLTGKELN